LSQTCYLHVLLYFLIPSSGIGIKITLEPDDRFMKEAETCSTL